MRLDESRYAGKPENLERWSEFLKKTRDYFYQTGYFEVSTPALVEAGAFESAIDTIKANASDGKWELHTSPEMEMKRLIADSGKSIFQIAKCFRDDPDTPIHGKEFTMLEYYKVGASYEDIIAETKQFFSYVSPNPISFEETTVETLFLEKAGIQLSQLTAGPRESWEDIFFKIIVDKIEPALAPGKAYLVKNYPTTTSALSRPIAKTIFSERFEIYWKGMELCNGCSENTSPKALEQNYEKESKKRIEEGKSPHPRPEKFFQSVRKMPACSGVAVGLDRLFQCL